MKMSSFWANKTGFVSYEFIAFWNDGQGKPGPYEICTETILACLTIAGNHVTGCADGIRTG